MTEQKVIDSRTNLVTRDEMYRYVGAIHNSITWPRWYVHKNGISQDNVGTARTLVTWSDARYDEGANIDLASTYDFIVPVGAGGIYFIMGVCTWVGHSDGAVLEANIFLDGSRYVGDQHQAAGTTVAQTKATVIVKLAEGEKVTVVAADTSAGVGDISGLAEYTYFCGCRIA